MLNLRHRSSFSFLSSCYYNSVWQHVDCMNLDRNNIPDEFMCELCQPRKVDRARARAIQYRKRQEFRLSTPPPSDRAAAMTGSGGSGRRDRAKDSHRPSKQDEYIDVEKTPKKFQRTTSSSSIPSSGGKVGRGGARNSSVIRGDGLKSGKRSVQQQKFKRKNEKQDESVPRKRKVRRNPAGLP